MPQLPEPYHSLFEAVCQDCSAEAIHAVVSLGADLNYSDPETGQTPLYRACMLDRPRTVEALLQNGANPNLRITYRSPIDKRIESDRIALHYARSSQVTNALLKAGSEVNAADKDGTTPLMCAAFRGPAEVVKALLEAGAFPLARQIKQRRRQASTARELAESKLAFFEENLSDCNRERAELRIKCYAEIRALLLAAEKQIAAP